MESSFFLSSPSYRRFSTERIPTCGYSSDDDGDNGDVDDDDIDNDDDDDISNDVDDQDDDDYDNYDGGGGDGEVSCLPLAVVPHGDPPSHNSCWLSKNTLGRRQ